MDIRASQTRTFFCLLEINDQIEQESLDVSIWGSQRTAKIGARSPILKLPQQFYRGERPRRARPNDCVPEVNFIRAQLGMVESLGERGPFAGMFVIGLRLSEVPPMPARVSRTFNQPRRQ